ncbi:hypothetical protein GIB67_037074, partial [Kingdonia uniflora]
VMERENLDEFLELTKTIDWITGDKTTPINNKVAVKGGNAELLTLFKIKRETMLLTIGIGTVCSGYCLVALSLQDHTKHICVPHDTNLAIEYHPATSADVEKKFDEESIHLCDHTSELDKDDSEAHVQQLIDHVQLYESKLNPSMTCANELVYIMGGYDGSTWLSSLESYSPSKETVRSHMPMRCIRAYSSATTFNGDIYIFGGGNGVELDVWYDSVAVVQLKAFNGAVVFDDNTLSDLNAENTKLLQKILIEVSAKNKSSEKELVDLSSRHGYGAYALAVAIVQMRSTASGAIICEGGMNLEFVGAEVGPWSKTDGLGDVLGGLPPAMAGNGHRIMTDYQCYNQYKDVWNTTISVEIKVGDKIETV